MELKPGYKQTEVGVIPEDWEVQSLQDLCKEEITYGIVQCGPHVPSGIPYIRVSDMDGPILDREKMLCTSSQIASRFRRSEVRHGDIVYALRGRLGDVRSVPLDLVGANLTQGTARISPGLSVHSPFLLWALRNPEVIFRACAESKGTTFMEITLSDLRRIKIALPPEPEQLRISSTLSDIEDHLMTLDRELAKKVNIKQAAMQELLTGKRRLPGFEEGWEVTTVKDVVSRHFCGPSPTCEERNIEGDNEWGVLKTTAITWENGWSWRAHKLLPPSYWGKTDIELRKGDVLVTKAGPRHRVGVSAWVDHLPSRIIPSGKMIALRPIPKKAEPLMLAAAIASRETQIFIDQRTTGMAESQVNFENSVLLAAPISLPGIAEQTAISEICRDFVEELQDLEKKAATLLRLKEGMMQQLLTGKIRLI